MLTLGVGWCNFWHRPCSPASAAGRRATDGRSRTTLTDYIAYIQQSFRATPDRGRTDLYRNSYRILKKNIHSNKTFETSLTTSRWSRYDLDKNYSNGSGVSKSIHITIAWPCLRIISRYLCTHSFPKTKRTFPAGAGRGSRRAARSSRSKLTDIH